MPSLQRQLDAFQAHYNEHRPHRALDCATPGQAYRATPKTAPATGGHSQGVERRLISGRARVAALFAYLPPTR